jgi:predicted transglutaminase-like cysteine proteinase
MLLLNNKGDVMTKFFIAALALIAGLPSAATAELDSRLLATVPSGDVMIVYGPTLPPIGYVQFCRANPMECRPATSTMTRVDLDSGLWIELNAVNSLVNETVEPISDLDLYGVVEYWTYPAGQGDCEDYVLLKRKLLMERGWPERSLLITVVRDEHGEGHAVLTVRTLQGDFILDNKHNEIETFDRTVYTLVKRQSHLEVRDWVSLVPQTGDENQVSSAR